VAQKTNYPWDGDAEITVTPAKAAEFSLFLRIPGWCEAAQVAVNGQAAGGATPGQYLAVRRQWKAGDVVKVHFEMAPQIIQANPRVVDDYGRAAVQRGPLVYCLEELDQPEGVRLFDALLDTRQAPPKFAAEYRKDLLGGVVVVKHLGAVGEESSGGRGLYSRFTPNTREVRATELRFIPYYAWANRAPTPMQVWTPVLSA
jgi:uncharacterized protein